MFRDYIYLDMKRITGYGKKCRIDKNIYEEIENSITEEMYFEEFEHKLEKEYIDDDFLILGEEGDEENINRVQKQMIIKFEKELLIPNEFGHVDFLKKILNNDNVKDNLTSTLSNNDDEIPKEFLSSIIKDRGSVPAYFEIDNYKIYTNLQGKFLRNLEYADFEENVGELVTVVAKVDNVCKIEKDIVLYSVYKDLLGLSREMRRSLRNNDNNSIPEEIKIHGQGIKISVLAIYK